MNIITETTDFKKIAESINQADSDTLVLFDVDEVILMDTDPYRLTHDYRKKWTKSGEERLSKEIRELLFSIILKDRVVRFVDPQIMEILTELERRKIPTLALTKLFTGKFGHIEDFTEWRLKEFQTLNLDFNKLTPIKGEMLIEELHIGCGIPTLKEGVILTANADKGKVLKHILRQKNYYPKSIIFVDDILGNVESLQKMCSELQIDYQGFTYIGASLVPEPNLNEEIERMRFEILEKEHRWVIENELSALGF